MSDLSVRLVYATPKRQWVFESRMPRGSEVRDLISKSNYLIEIEDLEGTTVNDLALGVFSQKVAADDLLEDGDRVEIYRLLQADPKELRRRLALMGKSIGKSGD